MVFIFGCVLGEGLSVITFLFFACRLDLDFGFTELFFLGVEGELGMDFVSELKLFLNYPAPLIGDAQLLCVQACSIHALTGGISCPTVTHRLMENIYAPPESAL